MRVAAELFVAALLLAPASAAFAQGDAPPAAEGTLAPAEFADVLEPSKWGIGQVVPDLAFTDLDGKGGKLSDYAARSALVIVVRDVGCPVSKRYGLRTSEIERELAAKNVAFLYLNPTIDDSVEECRAEVAEYGFAGRYARDHEGRFGWHLRVRSTGDVFVLDPQRRLRFRGAIDDQIGRGASKAEPTRHYLKDAVAALLAGERIEQPALSAPGCLLEFLVEPPPEPAAPPLTWFGGVESIARERCQGCHRIGGPGPFPLLAADDFAGAATMIREVVTAGAMPPWFATAQSGPFLHDMRLTAEQKQALLRWLQDGCPVGDPAQALQPPSWPSGWTIGEPDLVVEAPAVAIPATGVVDYITVNVPSGLKEDVWVEAMQILPEHPTVCHHVLAHAYYPEPQFMEFIDSYLPGRDATRFPPDQALLLQKGAVIRFNLHYTPDGTPVKERTRIGFKFAKAKPEFRVSGKIVREFTLRIPPRVEHYSVVSEYKFPFAAKVRRLVPHMHLRGKATTVEFIAPDGSRTVPLELERWDPDWQYAYEFVTPIDVARGTVVRCVSYFDNSAKNPFNPDPDVWVEQGPQIWDEMAGVFVEWYRPADAPTARDAAARDPANAKRPRKRPLRDDDHFDEGDDGGDRR